MRAIACLSLLVVASCKTGTTPADAGHDSGYHPRAPDGSVCDLGAVWLGDTCTVIDCSARNDRTLCRRLDGDAGQCLAARCGQPIDFASDRENCSANGAICAVGAICSHGQCFLDGGEIDTCAGVDCPAGDVCLFGYCVQQSCAGVTNDGLCAWGDAGGSGPWGNCCAGACTPLLTPANCGGCGVVCPSGYVCNYGSCQPIDACGPGNNQGTCAFDDGGAGACCDGVCVDLNRDGRHCGNCGDSCPTGSFCTGQVCRTDGGLSSPPLADCQDAGCPVGAFCATGWSCRPRSCGPNSDGNMCLQPNGLAFGMCCAGACANTVGDSANCGGCGVKCPAGQICVDNACAEPLDCSKVVAGPCAWDGGAYQGSCCGGHCVGNAHVAGPAGPDDCGSCGAGCPTGTHCGLYEGAAPICFSDVDAGPVFPPPSCGPDSCPAGLGCNGQQCYPIDCNGLRAGATCAISVDGGGGICCGGSCVLQRGATACGRCGTTCPVGSTCLGASCSPACAPDAGDCPSGTECQLPQGLCLTTDCTGLGDGATCGVPGFGGAVRDGLCCGGACIDPLKDPNNCRSCGAFCPSGVCSGNQGTCFDDAPQPCLVSCGPDQLCSATSCLSAVCPYVVPTPCASIYGTVGMCCPDRACADLTIDPANCGRCGVVCSSGQVCVAGVCSS